MEKFVIALLVIDALLVIVILLIYSILKERIERLERNSSWIIQEGSTDSKPIESVQEFLDRVRRRDDESLHGDS